MKRALLGLSIFLSAAWTIQAKPTITISKETTYATEPVDSEGRVDYVGALNERMRQGVTPENNANVLIWQALGPKVEHYTPPPQFFEMMGMKPPPEKGDYFITGDLGGQDIPASQWPWPEDEYPLTARWLQQNEKPLALIEEACKRTHFYFPIVPKSSDQNASLLSNSLSTVLTKSRYIALALKCRAMKKMGAGDDEAAWKDLQTLQRLGRLVAQGPYLVDMIVGISFIISAIEGEQILLSVAQPSAKQARAWLEESSRLGELPAFADKYTFGERLMSLDLLQSIAHGYRMKPLMFLMEKNHLALLEQTSRGKMDWDTAFRKVNKEFDHLGQLYRTPNYSDRSEAITKAKDSAIELQEKIKAINAKQAREMEPKARGELIGDAFLTMQKDSGATLVYPEFRIRQLQRHSQIALALAIYRAEKGKYPAQLADLAPKYLKQVPDDLFSGKPLIYKPSEKGYLLYSVGKNGKDDTGVGGQPLLKIGEKDDLIIRMPMRKLTVIEE